MHVIIIFVMKDIFREINSSDTEHARLTLVAYLKDVVVEKLNKEPEQAANTAYKVAGLMATDFARSLEPSDPINEIFTIAGELEINPPETSELHRELVDKINSL